MTATTRSAVTKACPVCGGQDTTLSVARDRLPVLQNRVFRTREDAMRSPCAPFQLATCRACGFSYNAIFESAKVVYDTAYDNDVPSQTFVSYYESVARSLIDRFDLDSGAVYDVGCGKGAFLQKLCELAPGIRGIGIDPSCEPRVEANFELRRDIFRPEHFAADAKLVVLRHVLEHIEEPIGFLSALRQSMPNVPLYVEVPDVKWIFANGAFWDFCYEHCNYFSLKSLKRALDVAGFEVVDQKTAFNGQYQWALSTPSQSTDEVIEMCDGAEDADEAAGYAVSEGARIRQARDMLSGAEGALLWGMATKGVIFSTLMGADNIVGGIDVNPRKQGRFVPGSGLEVHAPDWARQIAGAPTVVIMNPNYADEIRRELQEMGVDARAMVL